MTTALLTRRFLLDYGRNPVNVLLLVLIPIVFVVVAAGSMADAAEVLGGPGGPSVQTATAGWAAGFLAGVAMYFQISGSRAADRRLASAGLAPARLVAARLIAGLGLAVLATAAALVALQARTGIDEPIRVIAGTLMFAAIYVGIGALVGAFVRNPVNGTVLVLFVWIVDVFFGPAIGSLDRSATRVLPTHFVQLWMVDLPSAHGGRVDDLGWALLWTAAAVAGSWALIASQTRTARRVQAAPADGIRGELRTAVAMGMREAGRNRVLWVLLVVVPVVFVLGSVPITPDRPAMLSLTENGRAVIERLRLPDIHPGTMAPIAVASLATLAGLFIVLNARSADRRLTLAGFRTGRLLTARLTVIAVAVLLATAVSLAVTATVFDAKQPVVYAGGLLLIAVTYGLVGVLLGPVFGRVGGVFIAFLVPFLDVGIGQSPMLRDTPPAWARLVPGYGGSRVLYDGGFTATFDDTRPLLIGLAWLAALAVAAALVFRSATASGRRPVRATTERSIEA